MSRDKIWSFGGACFESGPHQLDWQFERQWSCRRHFPSGDGGGGGAGLQMSHPEIPRSCIYLCKGMSPKPPSKKSFNESRSLM